MVIGGLGFGMKGISVGVVKSSVLIIILFMFSVMFRLVGLNFVLVC